MVFEDRREAGKLLAKKLVPFQKEHPIVLALPRGGVPIGFEIAKSMYVPLDVLVVRKIGSPHNPEFGIGAIAEENTQILDKSSINTLGISKKELAGIIKKEKEELKRRVNLYRKNRSPPLMKDKTVIIVDDGLATGVTAKAAISSVKKGKPKQVIFAAPVCAYDTIQELKGLVDNVVCIAKPHDFGSVGRWYREFEQISDEEVINFLKK